MILSTGGLPGPRGVSAPGGVPGPRGCVCSWGVPGPRGCVCSRGRGGSWSQAGVCFQGVPGPGGCLLPGGCLVPGGVCSGGMPGGDPLGRLLLRAVRIILECILVSESDFRSQSTSERIQRSFPKISESDYINYFNNFQITF